MRDVEGGLRLAQFFTLPPALFIQSANAVEGFFDVGEAVDDRAAIGFQQFLLARRGLVALGAEAAVVEHRRKQPGGEVVEGAAQDVVGPVGTGADFGGEGHGRQHRGPGDGDVGLGRGQLRLGPGNVRTAAEQLAGYPGVNRRPGQLIEAFLTQRQRLNRAAEQGGEADPCILGLLLHQRQLALLRRHQAFLLCQFQGCGRTRIETGLHQFQHALGIGQIQLGDAALLLQRQGLRVTVGHTAEQRQFHGGLIELAGFETELRAVAAGPLATPEIDFVAGNQVRREVVDGVVIAVGIELTVAAAPQQFLAIGVDPGLDLGQLRAAGNHRVGLGLAHSGDGRGQVVAAEPRLFDQAPQLRAAEAVPPLLVVMDSACGVPGLPGSRRLDAAVGALWRGAAGAEQQAQG
ncbi:hypothetical protein D3C85_852120 [compost metagenome]